MCDVMWYDVMWCDVVWYDTIRYDMIYIGRLQAIIQTNAGILLIGPLGTKFIEIMIEINLYIFI